MYPVLVGLIAFSAIIGGAFTGMVVARKLPRHHLDPDSRNAVLVSMAVVSTLSTLVLSLLITQATSFFSIRANAVEELSINIERLDHALDSFGPDASEARYVLRIYTAAKRRELVEGADTSNSIRSLDLLDRLSSKIGKLTPRSEAQEFAHQQAANAIAAIVDARWLLAEKADADIPWAFLAVLITWLTLLFISFGLFSPRNPTVVVAIFACALSVSGGIYLIIELTNPSEGLLHTPVGALAAAEQALNHSASANTLLRAAHPDPR